MRVGIDARILYYTRGGIARYGRGLIEALSALRDRPELEIFLARKTGGEPHLNGSSGVTKRRLLSPPHFRFEEPLTAAELLLTNVDILHGIDFFVPTISRLPQILTIHDLYFLRDPAVLSADSLRHYRKILSYVPKAAHMICDSKATMNDLLHFTGCRPDRCSVVYPGIDSAWWAEKSLTPLPPEAMAPYLLIVSTLEPRKNIPKTIEAYAAVRKRLGTNAPKLLIAGRKGHQAELVFEAIRRLSLSESVIYCGEPTDEQLRSLYQSAVALLSLSSFEGFGFPALEAMACGTPVISAAGSAVEEFAGDAVKLCDPLEVESMRDTICDVIENGSVREMLSDIGRQTAQRHSWKAAAEQVRDIYRSL